MLKKWEDLPRWMQCPEVREYYDILRKRKVSLMLKRVFDLVAGVCILAVTAIPMIVLAVFIKMDSPGPVFYRQERVTVYGKKFRIHKFRTMVRNADQIGSALTVDGDCRITRIGRKLREHRLDELPQIFDVLSGNMSFVGTRPEVSKYVERYTKEMYATLLLPAGITSEASIRYKNESSLLNAAEDVDKVYIEDILPEKMKYNLWAIRKFSFCAEIMTVIRTVFAVLGSDFSDDVEMGMEATK